MNDDDDGWHLVPAALTQRMNGRGATKTKLVREGHVDWATVGKLLDGQPVTRQPALWRVAEYLGWRPDAFERIRRGEQPLEVETPAAAGSSDLRELLGVGGQIIDDRLTAIEKRLDRLEDTTNSDVVDLDARRSESGGVTEWARAASRTDGQPDRSPPTIGETVHRPAGPDVHPDNELDQDPGN